MEPFIAQIMLLGFNFAAKGWALCAGQIMSINSNQALFSILGTTYGGNGVQTFALPDLRGRVPIHWGQGPGQPVYVLGETGNTQSVTLNAGNLPLHTHLVSVSNGAGNNGSPSGNVLAQGPVISGANVSLYSTSSNTTMNATAIAPNGGNQPVSVLQPYLTLNYSIALTGIFPSRN
jgi:microcystin-dependent protein